MDPPPGSGAASGSTPPGSGAASGPGPPADSRCAFCHMDSSAMHNTNCSHTLCASCIFDMLQQRPSQTLCGCPICGCPITFLHQLKAVKEANIDISLIEKYNSEFFEDIRTRIHRKKDPLNTSQSQASGFPKLINIPWKIVKTWEKNDPSSKICKSVKSEKSARTTTLETKNLPTVSFKREEKYNYHAFKIMHSLNHKNLLHMLAAEHSKKHSGSIDTFLEQTSGKLLSVCGITASADEINHFPSPRFQSAVREIFIGLQFLSENFLYHGDLSWETTLYTHHGGLYTVKLAGFMSQDTMTLVEAQFNDRNCLAAMLRHHLDIVTGSNNLQIFCGHLSGLIRALERNDVKPLRANTKTILDNTFFWDEEKRTSFYTNVVSLRLKNQRFELMVEHFSICALPWHASTVFAYTGLVKEMNEFRRKKQMDLYDFGTNIDFLRCVCGSYTHRHQLKAVEIDTIIRQVHPELSIDLKEMVAEFDNQGFECPDDCKICEHLWKQGRLRNLLRHKFR